MSTKKIIAFTSLLFVITSAMAGPGDIAGSVYNYAINWAVQSGSSEITVEAQAKYCTACNPNTSGAPGCTAFGACFDGYGSQGCDLGYPNGTYIAARLKDVSTDTVLGTQKIVLQKGVNLTLGVVCKWQFVFGGLSLSAGQQVKVEADTYCSWCGHWYPNPVTVDIVGSDTETTYTGDTSALVGTSANVSATLIDKNTSSPIEGKTITFTLNPSSPIATVSAVTNTSGVASTTMPIPASTPGGTYTMDTRFAGDSSYFPSSDQDDFEVIVNQPPVALCQDVTVSAGPDGTADASVDNGSYDPDGDPITLTQVPPGPYSLGDTVVELTVSDGSLSDTCTATVTVIDDTPPTIDSLIAEPPVQSVGQDIMFTAVFSDNCGPPSASLDFGDSNTASVSSGVGVPHAYAAPGVYTVTLTVVDGSGNSAQQSILVVVFDPDGGFVTGGGWIDSPEGAYAADQSLVGKANFGFVSKYNKKDSSVPTGQTEFKFHVADLNFHSSSYEWLVVNQGGTNAQFKGAGTINDMGDYRFMIWAGDGEPDTFRIRIWEEDGVGNETDIYDNGFDQAISGGSIVIHTRDKK